MTDSRISGLFKLSVNERIRELEKLGWLSAAAAGDLQAGRQVVSLQAVDKMLENVIGIFGLPLAVAPNFVVNNRDCIVPLVVEEPSIVAGLSGAAALARTGGGFTASLSESLLAGQIHVVEFDDIEDAVKALADARESLIATADAVHPRLKQRGGGVRDIEFRTLQLASGSPLIAVHVLVDTGDAMGANLVNTICESLAPSIAEVCGGDVALRILSNLTDRSICSAIVRYSLDVLATADMTGEQVRDGIVLASQIADVDPYRAATHNKGVMNGVDAVALATGNDWRAIEAGAHAFAARDGVYSALTKWSVDADGNLAGSIDLPIKPGIVGGTLASNPAAALGLAISGAQSAEQLAELMAAVGLAQNFAALRALVTGGIQKGHMHLHARSVATAAGATESELDDVVEKLLASGEVKSWKAEEILKGLPIVEDIIEDNVQTTIATAAGKVILLGEHAVVYGRHALAVPIPDAVRAVVRPASGVSTINVKQWRLNSVVDVNSTEGVSGLINRILQELDAVELSFAIDVSSRLPRGMGLGSSAAIAVAITRAIAQCLGRDIDDQRVNDIGYACEQLAHGTPSGVDNTLSCFAKPMLFRNDGALEFETIEVAEELPLVVGFSHQAGPTHKQVAGVRSRYEEDPARYESLFDQIDGLSRDGALALTAGRYEELGRLMNLCHGLLNAIQVSTPDLENMIAIARESGAVGAKLTGAGGGGSIVALCPGSEDEVRSALHRSGYTTLSPSGSKGAAS
jgi:hydroxymethylglutaryl-CoA reductase